MVIVRIIAEEIAIALVAACIALGGFILKDILPIHEHICPFYEPMYVAGLCSGLFLGGTVAGIVAFSLKRLLLISVPFILLVTAPLQWKMYDAQGTLIYFVSWYYYTLLSIMCCFAGAFLAQTKIFDRALESVDSTARYIYGLVTNESKALEANRRSVDAVVVLKALLSVGLCLLGVLGAMSTHGIFFDKDWNTPSFVSLSLIPRFVFVFKPGAGSSVIWHSVLMLVAYIASLLMIYRCKIIYNR